MSLKCLSVSRSYFQCLLLRRSEFEKSAIVFRCGIDGFKLNKKFWGLQVCLLPLTTEQRSTKVYNCYILNITNAISVV